jgi:dihydroxy-acid dehydratase
LAAALREHPGADGEVVRREPITKTGGIVVLKGNLAPQGALIKVAGLKSLVFEGTARVFDSEEACADVVKRRAYKAGDVLVIRYEGPKGGPGMREMLGITALIYGQGPIALVRNGDRIQIDAAAGVLSLDVPKAELKRRSPKQPKRALSGVLEKYAAQVGSAYTGAVTHGRKA